MLQVIVLYPRPTDEIQFEKDYANHLALLHEKTGIPLTDKPYTVTKFFATPNGPATYYRMFTLSFNSLELMEAALSSAGMQEVSADAKRISTGGEPIILIGNIE